MCVCLSVPRIPPPTPPPSWFCCSHSFLALSLAYSFPSFLRYSILFSFPAPSLLHPFLSVRTCGTSTFIPLLSSFLIFFPPLSLPSPLIHSLVSLSPLTLFHTDSLPPCLFTHPPPQPLTFSVIPHVFIFSLTRKKAATLFLQTFYFSQHVIEVDENPKTSIKHLVCYGVGVWVSVWKFPSIKLFHSETLKHVQDISISSPVTNMQRG